MPACKTNITCIAQVTLIRKQGIVDLHFTQPKCTIKHSFYQAAFIPAIDMSFVVQHKASVSGFHINFCLDVEL